MNSLHTCWSDCSIHEWMYLVDKWTPVSGKQKRDLSCRFRPGTCPWRQDVEADSLVTEKKPCLIRPPSSPNHSMKLSYHQLMFWTPELDSLYNITEILAEKDQTGVQTATVIDCILINFLFFGLATQFMGSPFADQGLNSCPRKWKSGVLATGLPVNSTKNLCISTFLPHPTLSCLKTQMCLI